MSTVNDIIKDAMGIIGAIAIDEAPSASEMKVCLDALNSLIQQWSAQNLMIRQTSQITETLTAYKPSYTIGSGGDFSTTKPVDIESGFTRSPANVDTPLTIITIREYDRFADKSVTTGIPSYLAYDPGLAQQATAVGTIYLYPIPAANSSTTQACTISNATPGVITCAAHGYSIGNAVVFVTNGGLPTGLTVGTTYYIIAAGFTTGQFEVSATLGGTAINTSSAGSGSHAVGLSTAQVLYFRAEIPFTIFTTTADTVTFDAMYSEAMSYNLATRIWRRFHGVGQIIPVDIVALAAAAVKTIKMQNMQLRHQRMWERKSNTLQSVLDQPQQPDGN
jgi:hypothetical protein